MAGRQFSFFLGPQDQLPFEEALLATGQVVFLKDRPRSATPEEQESSVISRFGEEWLQLLIARRGDLKDISFNPIKNRGDFSCDITLDPVVQFSRCYIDSKIISAGRLYRIDKYYNENGILTSKSTEFIKWADLLFKNGKKILHRIEQGFYAGTEALTLRKAGVQFEGLDSPLR
jgi:hypothetical protein